MRFVHIRLNFEHERRKIGAERVNHAAIRLACERAGRHAQKLLQKRLNTEIGERRAEEHRRQLAAADLVHIKIAPSAEQLHVVHKLLLALFADERRDLRIVQRKLQLFGAALARNARKQQKLAAPAVIHAAKFPP